MVVKLISEKTSTYRNRKLIVLEVDGVRRRYSINKTVVKALKHLLKK